MIIQNALVFQDDASFIDKELYTNGEYISDTPHGEVLDASNCFAIPGLVDIHFHGCMGADFCNGSMESIDTIAKYQLQNGVMAICPASMTLSEDMLAQIFETAANYKNGAGADLVGINMEGPFIHSSKKGAQNPKYIVPCNVDMFRRLQQKANGLIKICDVAPETEGALDFIEQVKDEVVISVCHTTANYEQTQVAFQKGAKQLTHMYNAMNGLSHRDAGPIGAAFDTDFARVEIITDGIHIAPTMVRLAFTMFGDDRVMLISDSMEATGMPDGQYSLGGQTVIKQGKIATLADGTIAGSATNLYDCMVNAVQNMGIPLASAVKCASVNPAKEIGIYHKYGSLDKNKYANIILVDKDTLQIKYRVFKGKLIA
ncbi:MAG: N-acetylglucosamine-6-phosphate deacetylase [Eubacteriales bacterium]|nr:N-acetylglucosamine-6-phosphate deacetylase [Eubacteriales bacterium]